MLVLVTTGGRDYKLTDADRLILGALDPEIVHVGDATGADEGVWDWAYQHLRSYNRYQFKADWLSYGKGAGPERNGRMLRAALDCLRHSSKYRLILLAFPGGRGTENCIYQAKGMGIPVIYAHPAS